MVTWILELDGSKAREDDRRGVRRIELAGHPCEQQHGWAVCVCVLQVRSDLCLAAEVAGESECDGSALHSGAKLCTEYATESEMADTQLYGTMGRAAHSGAVTGVSHGRSGTVCAGRGGSVRLYHEGRVRPAALLGTAARHTSHPPAPHRRAEKSN